MSNYDRYPAVDENYNFPDEVRSALSRSLELRNTVVPMTQVLRNNLSNAELWDGRVILNTTTDRLNRYDLTSNSWIDITDEAISSAKNGISQDQARTFVDITTSGMTGKLHYARDFNRVFGEFVLTGALNGVANIPLPVPAANLFSNGWSIACGQGYVFRLQAPTVGPAIPVLFDANNIRLLASDYTQLYNGSYGAWNASDSVRGTFEYFCS